MQNEAPLSPDADDLGSTGYRPEVGGLPAVRDAPLPATYERAKQALAECHEVDECKDWADKAQALASYAKQADDDALYKMARRIQGRAVRRAGELLKTFQSNGGRPPKTTVGDRRSFSDTPATQREAAREAGMSEHQEKQAVRVSNVPESDFEAAVESDDPPSVTALAERGKETLTKPKPQGFQAATQLWGELGRLADFCARHDPKEVVGGYEGRAIAGEVTERAAMVVDWLSRFQSEMEGV